MTDLRRAIGAVDALAPWAVRYALGRMTYSMYQVTETLIAHRAELTGQTRQGIIWDIDEALAKGRAGMQTDIDAWQRLRAALVEDLLNGTRLPDNRTDVP